MFGAVVRCVGSVKGGRDAVQGRLGAPGRERPRCRVQVAKVVFMKIRRLLVALLVALLVILLVVPLMPLLVVRKALMVSEVVLFVRVPMAMPMLCLKGAPVVERRRHHMVHLDKMCHCII